MRIPMKSTSIMRRNNTSGLHCGGAGERSNRNLSSNCAAAEAEAATRTGAMRASQTFPLIP